jgi:GMP synthase (glutamine-hydrolysing)
MAKRKKMIEKKKKKTTARDLHSEKILILDFGSQYTQLIARRVREQKVYCEIWPCTAEPAAIRRFNPRGVILSGGPASVYDEEAPLGPKGVFKLGVPVLGICYGMQVMAHALGGEVGHARGREYGRAHLEILRGGGLFHGLSGKSGKIPDVVWMSHGDKINVLPNGFKPVARTANAPVAAMADVRRKLFGLQFHPEVVHTPMGTRILENFVRRLCGCRPIWDMKSFVDYTIASVRRKVGKNGKVVCALSGGVDSSVVALLLHRAIGDRLTCIFVDNGLKVFEKEAKRIGKVDFLAQGTLYPDVIESVSFKGPSAVIKSHHNVGGLPEVMRLKLIEPLRELFKDEVRIVGREIGLPEEIVQRQPFPGPGLAIRVIDEVTDENLELLRAADAVITEEVVKAGLYREIWQSFAVLLPVRSVGVMGDFRTYEKVVAVRAVHSRDGMTADWVALPARILRRISSRIINEVRGVNRVVYDISSKPPSTIEWE